MIGKLLGIGKSDFSSVINSNNIYFDKTLLIKDILDSNNEVTLLTRPRRFGKTLNLSMIEHFFDITKKEQNAPLFTNLNIMNTEYKDRLGSNPVINISFKDVKFDNTNKINNELIKAIARLYDEHKYLMNKLNDYEKEEYISITYKKLELDDLTDSLLILCKHLYRYHNKKVVLLIDEYDTPIISAYVNLSTDKYAYIKSFISKLYSTALKDNEYLEFSVMTGILRIAKENIFSGLNNLEVNTILSKDFSTYFGFTHDEVKEALQFFNIPDKFDEVCSWYDGYNFGGNQIFNAWSILNYLKKQELVPYWINTASNDLLKYHFKRLSKENIGKLNTLLKGQSITVSLSDNTILENVYDDKNIWALLLYSGYLTVDKHIERNVYSIKLVNFEISDTIEETFLNSAYSIESHFELKNMFELLLNDNIEEFEQELNKLTKLEETFNDFRIEKDYRLYFSTLLILLRDRFVKFNELEAGIGRADLLFYTKDLEKGYLIEFKRAEKFEDIEKQHIEGKNQIDSREYRLIFEKLGLKNVNVYTVVGYNKNMYFKKY